MDELTKQYFRILIKEVKAKLKKEKLLKEGFVLTKYTKPLKGYAARKKRASRKRLSS